MNWLLVFLSYVLKMQIGKQVSMQKVYDNGNVWKEPLYYDT